MTVYEKRIRERFPSLVADPVWSLVERLVREDWRDDDEDWFGGVQRHCIDLSKRLGLPVGPPACGDCGEPLSDFTSFDELDGRVCPRCVAKKAREQAALDAGRAAREARRANMSAAEKEAEARIARAYADGLNMRDVE